MDGGLKLRFGRVGVVKNDYVVFFFFFWGRGRGGNASQEDAFLRKHPKNNQKPKTHGKTKRNNQLKKTKPQKNQLSNFDTIPKKHLKNNQKDQPIQQFESTHVLKLPEKQPKKHKQSKHRLRNTHLENSRKNSQSKTPI